MGIKTVWAVYFSPTGTTRKVVRRIAAGMAAKLGLDQQELDFTTPAGREHPLRFTAEDVVVFGTPVYAGRIPNVLLKFLETMKGGGALAVPVALFGNRNYDDALIEQRDLLARRGLRPLAAAAFVGEHSFSTILGGGRPDDRDMQLIDQFASLAADKVREVENGAEPVQPEVSGIPYPHAGYYQPRDRHGNPIDIRKVKPLTAEHCTGCKLCVEVCPMGSISPEDVREFTGICIKCGACSKRCPHGARYYDDEGYLYHKQELEEGYERRAEPTLYV